MQNKSLIINKNITFKLVDLKNLILVNENANAIYINELELLDRKKERLLRLLKKLLTKQLY